MKYEILRDIYPWIKGDVVDSQEIKQRGYKPDNNVDGHKWFKEIKETTQFKVGDWVTKPESEFFVKIIEKNIHNQLIASGTGSCGYRIVNSSVGIRNCRIATNKEIQAYLVKQAIERGLIQGATIQSVVDNKVYTLSAGSYSYDSSNDSLISGNQATVYYNNKWSEVIKEPKKEFKVGDWVKDKLENIIGIVKENNVLKSNILIISSTFGNTYCSAYNLEHVLQEELKKYYIELAKEKGFQQGIQYQSILYPNARNTCGNLDDLKISYENNSIKLTINGNYLYYRNQWAKIVKENEVEIHGYKIEKVANNRIKIGCAHFEGKELHNLCKTIISFNKVDRVWQNRLVDYIELNSDVKLTINDIEKIYNWLDKNTNISD